MQQDPDFGHVRLDSDTTQPQVSIRIDRARAADVGIPVATIATAGRPPQRRQDRHLLRRRRSIKIFVQAPDGIIQDPRGLDHFHLKTASGKMVPLSSLVTFEEGAVAPKLRRQDQRRAMPMTATLARASISGRR